MISVSVPVLLGMRATARISSSAAPLLGAKLVSRLPTALSRAMRLRDPPATMVKSPASTIPPSGWTAIALTVSFAPGY